MNEYDSTNSVVYTPVQMSVLGTGTTIDSQLTWHVPMSNGGLRVQSSMVEGDAKDGAPRSKQIGIGLFFRFVKSRFTKLEEKKIREAVKRYAALRFDAQHLGQRGLYEQLSELLVLAVREQQCLACGYALRIPRADILKYIDRVEKRVILCPLGQFPRVIPPEPAELLAKAQERKLFDDYHVLFHPATEEKKALSTADKVKAKDPIIFGSFAYGPEMLYPVADWIDEHCDLTVEKLVTGLKTVEKNYKLKKIKLPTEKDIRAMEEEILRSKKVVASATHGNFRQLEKEERAKEGTKKGNWWTRLTSRLFP